MSLKKRLTAVVITAIAAAITFGIAYSGMQISEKKEEIIVDIGSGKDTLYLWYTDEALTSYLSGAAVAYNEDHDVRIVPVLETGLEYLENINKASVESNAPDLYILSHDSLEKAYLAGLANEVETYASEHGINLEDKYMGTGLQAATYKDKILGYPFYFETSSLLYNKTYLEEMAAKQLEAEIDEAMALEAEADLEENGPVATAAPTATPAVSPTPTATPASGTAAVAANATASPTPEATPTPEPTATPTPPYTPEQVEQRVQEMLPGSIEALKTLADGYDAPEQVEGVFKWDVTDIFYNYFFVGNAINMGGEAGWDTSQIDIYNLEAIESMKVYQELNQFFSIDTSDCDYDEILDDFMAGKMVFTVATTDAVFKLEDAKADALFNYEYGVMTIPDINDELKTRSLSMTNCVVVNGYSAHKDAANDFALFLTGEYNNILYARSGKVSAAKDVEYGYDALYHFAEEYESSVSMPKMLETSNFWVQLEVAFSQIWNGADANSKLKELSEQIMRQVTGEEYREEYIEEPEEEIDEEEYLDAGDYIEE